MPANVSIDSWVARTPQPLEGSKVEQAVAGVGLPSAGEHPSFECIDLQMERRPDF